MEKRKKINMGNNTGIPYKHGYYYDNELWFSEAYQTLSKAARELLHSLLNELRFRKNKRKGNRREYTNNGGVSFTEVHFKERYGYCSATYLKARNQLIKNGLIKQTYRGGMTKGDRAKYKLLFIDGVLLSEKKWLKYPEEHWESEIPRPKKQLIGVATQWKKGQSGRKLKSTLQNNSKKGRYTLPKKPLRNKSNIKKKLIK